MTTHHIQVPDIAPHIQYTANGTQTVFPFPFPVFAQNQLRVTIDQIVQTTSFSVHGAGESSGGTVTFNSPPHNGAIITIERRIPFRRMGDFSEGGELSANTMNTELDLLMMCAQQLQFDQNGMLHFANSDQYGQTTLPNKNARANKVLGFDENGNPAVYETSDTYAAPSVTQSGIGAVARPLTDKVSDHVSVRDFGATGDGVADDTGAIQNAINAHGRVFIPPGTYRMTGPLVITENKHVFGAGPATILHADNDSIDIVTVTGSHNTLTDMQLRYGATAVRLYGSLSPCRHNTLSRLVLYNQGIALELDGYMDIAAPCAHNGFYDLVIEKPKTHGVHLTRSGTGSRPTDNMFYNVAVLSRDTETTGSGFFIESARGGNSFTQCVADMAATAAACFTIEFDSDKTRLVNISTKSSGSVPHVALAGGSSDTSVVNLTAQGGGPAIDDASGGAYTAFNAGNGFASFLNHTHIRKLTTDIQHFNAATIALAADGTVALDMTRSVYLVDASLAVTTLQLPKAHDDNAGMQVIIKKTDTSFKQVHITEIDGPGPDGRTLTLGNRYDTATLLSNGAQWLVLNSSIASHHHFVKTGGGTYDLDVTRRLHLVNGSAGATGARLPSAANAISMGRLVTIKKIDSTNSVVTVSELGGPGPDGGSVLLNARGQYVTVLSDGTSWHIVGKHS